MKMPVIFVGHGSPMNAIENNSFTAEWEKLGNRLPRPKAILCISAHWYTEQTKTSDAIEPRMIYDMYGFPKALYELKYPVKGSALLSKQIIDRLGDLVTIDNEWGIDHGTWSVLCRMFPEANIPVVQVSVNYNVPAQTHYDIGQKLADLRNEGILIMGSGNVVHNLALINWGMEKGYDWAQEFDDYIKMNILNRSYDDVVHYERSGKCAEQAFYTPDHFYPLLYVLGAADKTERIEVFNDVCAMGSMSMTSYLFGI